MKLCKNCKWCRPAWFPFFFSRLRWEFARCARPELQTKPIIDLVDGSTEKKRKPFADLSRLFESDCGKEARYFEEK